MKYVYPAVFTVEDGKTLVSIPDLPGCHVFGDTLAEAIELAKDAAETWLWDAENEKEAIPSASSIEKVMQEMAAGATISFVLADTDEYRRQNDSRSVSRTVTVPAWLDYQAKQANAPFSQILQQGLKEYLRIAV